MDITRICINCLKRKASAEGTCEYCGFDSNAYETPKFALPKYTILNGNYLVCRVLGAGGFGITYLAYDLNLDYPVAIKEYFVRQLMFRDGPKDPRVYSSLYSAQESSLYHSARERFEKEAKLLAKCGDLPGIVNVRAFFQENNTAYIVMDYLKGQTLKEYVEERGALGWQETIQALRPIMESLQKLHEQGIIHRDISPDNLVFSGQGELKLIDFGGVKQSAADGFRRSSMVLMKDGYTPLEQISNSGSQGPWSDVFAMASTIASCVSGKTPASVTTWAAEQLPESYAESGILTRQQESVLKKGMAAHYENRYQSMGEFLEAIDSVTSGSSGKRRSKDAPVKKANAQTGSTSREKGGADGRKGSGGKWALALLVALLAGGGVFAWQRLQAPLGYAVKVADGHADKERYTEGETVYLQAREADDGEVFVSWEVTDGQVTLLRPELELTSFVMPAEDVSVAARYTPETEIETEADAETEIETEAYAETEIRTEAYAESEIETEAYAESEIETEADAETEIETEAEPETEAWEPEVRYDLPLGEGVVRGLPYWGWDVDGMNCYLRDEAHPDGEDVWISFTDVALRQEELQKSPEELAELPEEESHLLRITRQEREDGSPFWHLEGRQYGSGVVVYSYLDAYGVQGEIEQPFEIGSHYYEVQIASDTGCDFILPGESMDLCASVLHYAEGEDGTYEEGMTYTWDVPEESRRYLEVSVDEAHPEVAHVRAKTREEAGYSGAEEVLTEAFVTLRVTGTDPDTGEMVLISDQGDQEEITWRLQYFSAYLRLDVFDAREDGSDPVRADLRDLAFGEERRILLEGNHYWVGPDGAAYREQIQADHMRLVWDFDETVLSITDAKGQPIRPWEPGEDYGASGEDGADAKQEFVVTRLRPWGSYVSIFLQIMDEDGNWADAAILFVELNDCTHNVWLEGETEDFHSFDVFTDGRAQLNVNTSRLDAAGIEYTIRWEFGTEWDENGELTQTIDGDWYEISGEKGEILTLFGDRMQQVEEITAGWHVNVQARVMVGDLEMTRADAGVELRETQCDYDFPLGEGTVWLPHWGWSGDGMNCYLRDAAHPDGEDVWIPFTDVTLRREELEQSPEELAELPEEEAHLLRISRQEGEDGSAFWDLEGLQHGSGTVAFSYLDPYGQEEEIERSIEVRRHVYQLQISTETGCHFILPGESMDLRASVFHYAEGEDGAYAEGMTYSWGLTEEGLRYLEASGDPAHSEVVTVRARTREEAGYSDAEEVWAETYVALKVTGTDPDTRETILISGQEEQEETHYWLQVASSYLQLDLFDAQEEGEDRVRVDLRDLALGEERRILLEGNDYWVGPDEAAYREQIRRDHMRLVWDFDENVLSITDAKGQPVRPWEPGEDYGASGEDGADAKQEFVVTRLRPWGSYVNIFLQIMDEEGNWVEAAARYMDLNDCTHSVWLEGEMEDPYAAMLFTDEQRQISLNTSRLDAEGIEYTIQWEFGTEWDENGELTQTIDGDWYEISGEKGEILTLFGDRMQQVEEITAGWHVNAQARVMVGDLEMTRVSAGVELREAE